MTKRKHHHQPAREFALTYDLRLISEVTQDGERIQAERQAQDAARSAGEKLQLQFSETSNQNTQNL